MALRVWIVNKYGRAGHWPLPAAGPSPSVYPCSSVAGLSVVSSPLTTGH